MVKLYRYLCTEKKEFVLSKQIVRSGASIGANVEEAIGGQSKMDFLSKMGIAYKEARETHFWLRLLRDSPPLYLCAFVPLSLLIPNWRAPARLPPLSELFPLNSFLFSPRPRAPSPSL